MPLNGDSPSFALRQLMTLLECSTVTQSRRVGRFASILLEQFGWPEAA